MSQITFPFDKPIKRQLAYRSVQLNSVVSHFSFLEICPTNAAVNTLQPISMGSNANVGLSGSPNLGAFEA